MARNMLWDPGMTSQRSCANRTAFALAAVLVALAAGAGPAHADDADAPDAPEATQTSARTG